MATNEIRVACMDFRVGGNNKFRNAGAAVDALSDQIIKLVKESTSPVEVDVVVHRDCGAVKAVAAILDGADLGLSRESTELFERTFVRHFRDQGLEGATKPDGTYDAPKLRAIEDFNLALQKRLAGEILGSIGRSDVNVNATIIDVAKGLHADTVVVALGQSELTDAQILKAAGSAPGDAYLIRTTTAEEAAPSLEIAKRVMGKTDIRIIALDAPGRIQESLLREKPFMKAKNHA